ncbi:MULTISPECIES: hypothetical protein [Photobacterium]|uniref:Uncharacterized protein n=2 Tax=Photobacterium TaxID=657 RepID=A0A2T3HVJ0_9GAMM|nr:MULTISPECIES: hypothetical protein [Photobacterium]MCP4957149.1 hypothetical protein [Photobacterium aquimaris]OBU14232.1 hypothetical protein AYY21_07570 [Photobacterium aquimaris]PQJ38006.1 hypothetical protein BTN98_11065 [Photobacterium aquimaris]PSU02531.1 hypothetical protein C0W81_14295 [Photobacterium aquimaris]SMY35122.1 hypothetical protein PAND9192_01790 [Photobacterium andalusiense]
MSNIVQLSAFNNNKKTTPASQAPSPKALREQAVLQQQNQCYFCGLRKDTKELNWLNQIGFKQKTHVVCNSCCTDAKSRSMDELRIILALKAMDFRTVKLKQYLELREKGVQIDGVRDYKFHFETIK